jgi:Cdc6-like AAA superfamily ATPase
MPSKGMEKESFFVELGKREFVLIYDIPNRATLMGVPEDIAEYKVEELQKIIPGMKLESVGSSPFNETQRLDVISFYKKPKEFDNDDTFDPHDLHDAFELARNDFLAIAFVPVDINELNKTKNYIEKTLSRRSVRETYSILKNTLQSRINISSQRDIFIESEEAIMLSNVLESINNAILTNGPIYKSFFIIPSGPNKVCEFISARFLILDSYESTDSLELLLAKLSNKKAFPFGMEHLKPLLDPYGAQRLSYILPTVVPSIRSGIDVGTFMKNGATDTNISIKIDPSTMNLGFIITGLPGSGKTTEAMAIIDTLLNEKNASRKPKVVVITPTTEWDKFASSHGMYLIKPYEDKTPINLFRKPKCINTEKFYESLATVLSSASNAGPYQNPMEKCMLNAFRKVYASEEEPDPIAVYDEIENSIIELHAKRTNTGVKYTKHGENIRSALENLRGILSRPEFSVKSGIKIEDLISNGAVYNISSASGTTRAYLYALLLNQVYAITSSFDANGDSELRLLVCLEEAQTMFSDKDSAAVQDIKQRIQDFRRQGVGLMILTHNVNDIDAGVRRLCQLKLYLKQASDVATVASKDLVFTYADENDITLKLKLLDSRVGAFSHISKSDAEKITQDTIFIRTKEYNNGNNQTYENPLHKLLKNSPSLLPNELNTTVHITLDKTDEQACRLVASMCVMRFRYLGEVIAEHMIETNKDITQTLLEGKIYKIQILDKKGKILKESNLKAKNRLLIPI